MGKLDKVNSKDPKNMLFSTAGKEHVVFSKALLRIIALVVFSATAVFFLIEQYRIEENVILSRSAVVQNEIIKKKNAAMEDAKGELQDEEDELVDMYSKWIDEDDAELELDEQQEKDLREQFTHMQEKIKAHSGAMADKAKTLDNKEKRLQKYQFKIQQKQSYIDQMGDILRALNKTAPETSIDADPEDFYVDDDFEFDEPCLSSPFASMQARRSCRLCTPRISA